MKFYDKYPLLKQKQFLAEVLVNDIFSTMCLENQILPKIKVQELVNLLLEERELKGTQFFSN